MEVHCRTLHGRFLLRPSRDLNEVVIGILERAARRYRVRLCLLTYLSNHCHLLLWLADARQLARFIGFVNGNLSKQAGRLDGWRERIWGWRCTTILVSHEEAARSLLQKHFFAEINRSAVPVDLRAVHQLKSSPLSLDLYTWLTYRMSYLRKPKLVPWKGLQAQLGADYARPRDFRRAALARLEDVVGAYPELRIRGQSEGLRLYPSPPHVTR